MAVFVARAERGKAQENLSYFRLPLEGKLSLNLMGGTLVPEKQGGTTAIHHGRQIALLHLLLLSRRWPAGFCLSSNPLCSCPLLPLTRMASPLPPSSSNREANALKNDDIVKTPYGWGRVTDLRPDGFIAVKLEWHATAYLHAEDIAER